MKDDVIKWITKNGKHIPLTNDYMNNMLRKQSNVSIDNQEEKTYQLTDNQLQNVIDESISKWDDNYAGLYITKMSPETFLNLTATPKAMEWIEQNKFDLDIEQVKAKNRVADMMYLDIDLGTGEVRGHEGRHRAYAFKNADYKEVDVVVFPYNYDKYNAKEYSNFTLKGQESLSYKEAQLEKLTPVSKANIEKIKNRDY